MSYDFDEFPVFKGLNSTQVENFVAACRDEQHDEGSTLIKEATAGDSVYFLYEGKVSVDILSNEGSSRLLAELSAPAVLGEMEFLTGSPRSATVTALGPVRALAISFENLTSRVDDGDPATLKVFYNVSTVLANRLAAMDKKLSEIEMAEETHTADLVAFHRKIFEDWNV